LVILAGAATAAPDTSLRPVTRSGAAQGGPVPLTLEQSGTIAAPQRSDAGQVAADRGQGIGTSLRPKPRPRKVERAAQRQQRQQAKLRAKGAVCGDPDIQGEVIGRVTSKNRSCGIKNAVRVTSVAGVALSPRATIDCPTASALKSWVENSAKPTFARTGGGLKNLRVAAHYACRTRNNQPGAKVSEHGRGRAIDISGFQFRDGTGVTVLKGWNARGSSDALRRLHKDACGTFGTVLGPQSDRFHKDHFHFDTARYDNGAYCR
jgi:hypothetical protein